MEESPAPAVLSGDAHAVALLDQSSVGQRLGAPPVERQLSGEHLPAVGDDLRHAWMQAEALRVRCEPLTKCPKVRKLDPSLHSLRPVDLGKRAPVHGELVANHYQRGARLRASFVE